LLALSIRPSTSDWTIGDDARLAHPDLFDAARETGEVREVGVEFEGYLYDADAELVDLRGELGL
jgi:hypothetical protein